jgi:hypothetical protein
LDQKLQFIYPKASVNEEELQKKPSALKRENPALQDVKFLVWVFFAFLDPDPDHWLLPTTFLYPTPA